MRSRFGALRADGIVDRRYPLYRRCMARSKLPFQTDVSYSKLALSGNNVRLLPLTIVSNVEATFEWARGWETLRA